MMSAFIAMLIAAVFLHFGGTEETSRHDPAPPAERVTPANPDAPASQPASYVRHHHR